MNSYRNISKSNHRALDIFPLDMIQLPPLENKCPNKGLPIIGSYDAFEKGERHI